MYGCCHSIIIVFGNDSSETDLVSELSFPQLEYHALRCIVDAAKTKPGTRTIYVYSAFSNVRSYSRRSFSCTGLSRIPNTILYLNM